MNIDSKVTGIVVNYKTLDLIERSVEAFRSFYSELPLIIIDNSSFDASSDWIYNFARNDLDTTCLFNTFNMHHGPGLDTAIKLSKTQYVFLFDSDTFILKEGLIEKLYSKIPKTSNWYAVSKVGRVKYNGFDCKDGPIKYFNPRCALVNKEMYLQFAPFKLHGAPCLYAMVDLKNTNNDKLLIHYNYEDKGYIQHLERGTVSRYGWNLECNDL